MKKDRIIERVETIRIGVQGQEPLYKRHPLEQARSDFIRLFNREPKQLRLSPKCFNDLRAFAERWDYPYGFDVKVDYDFSEEQWMVCNEETKVYAERTEGNDMQLDGVQSDDEVNDKASSHAN